MIGLSGAATTGKDTFFNYLSKLIPEKKFVRFALADNLKLKTKFLCNDFNLDVFNLTKEDKDLFRPLFVSLGKIYRIKSNGTYWTNLIQTKINDAKKDNYFPVITDIRYCEYEKDEHDWLINQNKGKLIFLERYDEKNNLIYGANEDEILNNILLKSKANLVITMPTFINSDEYISFMKDKYLTKIKELIYE